MDDSKPTGYSPREELLNTAIKEIKELEKEHDAEQNSDTNTQPKQPILNQPKDREFIIVYTPVSDFKILNYQIEAPSKKLALKRFYRNFYPARLINIIELD